jgi:group I intron endonuclease
MGIIYKITHLATGKSYIGRHHKSDHLARFKAHARSNSLIGNYIRKYGMSAFEVSILDSANSDSDLARLEQYWIDELKTLHPEGLNLAIGGQGKSGHEQHETTRLACSLAQKGNKNKRCLTPEEVQEIRNSTQQYGFLAHRFGVSQGTIRRCKDYTTYSELP